MKSTLWLALLITWQPPQATGPGQVKPPVYVQDAKGAGDGVEWQGKRARLRDGWELNVQDANSKQSPWSTSICPTWDTITFEQVAKPNEVARWVLVLKASKYPGHARVYDLADGKPVETREPPPPVGTVFKPRKVWEGEAGVQDKPKEMLVGSKEQWAKVRAELFGPKPKPEEVPSLDEIDFTNEMLLILYEGKTTKFRHTPPELYIEQEAQVLVREERRSMNTFVGFAADDPKNPDRPMMYCYSGYLRTKTADPHPFVIVTLPKRTKVVVIEHVNVRYLADPSFWSERTRLSLDQPK